MLVKVLVLRAVMASGVALAAGQVAEVSPADALLLVRMGKAELVAPAGSASTGSARKRSQASDPAIDSTEKR